MKTLFLLMFLLAGLACQISKEKGPMSYYAELDLNADPNTLSRKEMRKGWELLFDGKSTSGWRGFNMKNFPESWKIEDGALTMITRGRGESQDIITEEIYDKYVFTTEVKFSKGSNSGVIFQVKEDPKYKFPYETGPEFQIIDHESWRNPYKFYFYSHENPS